MKPKNHKIVSIAQDNAAFITMMLLFIVIWLLNIPIAETLWRHSFDDGTYSHSYLIPVIILYLYHNLARIGMLQFSQKATISKVLLLIFSCICLFLTSTAQLSTGYWLAILLVCLAAINLLFRFNWYLLFPATLMVFIFPIWGTLVPLLQSVSTTAVSFIMGFSGIPIYVEQQFITIPAGVFEIAGGCSGLRYLIVSLAISSLFIFLYIQNVKRAGLFLMVAILGALLTNWIRITTLIVIGDYTDMQSSLMTDHNAFGWYLYIPFMLILFLWGNKLSDYDLINVTNDSQSTGSGPNVNGLVILLLSILITSTSIGSTFFANESSDIITSELSTEIKPAINFYAAVTQENETNSIKLTYYFDGSELDGKPSYYANNVIPAGWKAIAQEQHQKGQIYKVSNGYKKALVVVNYEINQQQFSTLKAFKVARLAMAVKHINQTKLHWLFIACQNTCVAEVDLL